MCEAGFKVLDIFPMSYTFPHGTGLGKGGDGVHYREEAFLPVEKFLRKYFDSEDHNL